MSDVRPETLWPAAKRRNESRLEAAGIASACDVSASLAFFFVAFVFFVVNPYPGSHA